ncbi:MAG: helix-turn-helix transcriptional regulator [Pseudobutyrivibrio sp.]|nr:helix-turn-helix transcriptional regulator [Pseudobutyrivibrio sp.]
MPLMRENTPGVYIAWVASYLLGGLISVFRAVAFLDTANENQLFYLAPMGLFIGRVGESVGYLIRTRLFNNYVVLLLIISVFFALAIVLFALVYSFAYLKPEANALPEIDYHASFVGRYQLSTREIQILDEILSGKANKEIAAILFITEATVKFHVKNLLQKTNCKNRNELTKLYNDGNNSL